MIMPKDILYRHVTELITTTYKDFAIYACGGFVRDLALGIEPKDLDLVVSTNPEVFADELSKILESNYFVLDETRNIFRITYSRSDVILNIDISELVVSIENDALTRDFTINTLYISLDKLLVENPIQYIIDPLKGLSHLNHRKLIAVNEDVFKDDTIRLLRAVRLSEFLNLEIDNQTKKRIREDSK